MPSFNPLRLGGWSAAFLALAFATGCATTTVDGVEAPVIERLNLSSVVVLPNGQIDVEVVASGSSELSYAWFSELGNFDDATSSATSWRAPASEAVVGISVIVTDAANNSTELTTDVEVGTGPDGDGDGFSLLQGDCNDADPAIYPGAPEQPDGIDNDCDGLLDEGSPELDDDADGFSDLEGDCNDADASIYPGAPEAVNGRDDDCDGLVDEGTDDFDDDGDGFSESDGDCDDTNNAIAPDRPEVLDGIDNDCDGLIDETTSNTDDDMDGFTELSGDCDDGNDLVYPGAEELPDGLDNDCDGLVDDGSIASDDDRDGWTELAGDCDDNARYTYPGAPELGDGEDNDCDGEIDESLDSSDADADGFSEADGDCDDADPAIYPGALEIDDGKDNDCDGFGFSDPPVAIATWSGSTETCSTVTLDASESFDPNGDTLDFYWYFASQPIDSALDNEDIADADQMMASFQADRPGYWSVGLIVNDGLANSVPATVGVTITERPGNNPPEAAIAGSDTITVAENVTCTPDAYGVYNCPSCDAANVTLDASASTDPDGDFLFYLWEGRVLSGSTTVSIADPMAESTEATITGLPATFGSTISVSLEYTVTVHDCNGRESSAAVTVNYSCTGS